MDYSDYSSDLHQRNYSPYQSRLDSEWMTAIALRDTVGLSGRPSTYKQILDLADELAPNLFGRHNLLAQERESIEAREYRQMADALSVEEGRLVTPSEAVNKEIEKFRRLLTGEGTEREIC